jgi:branched-chain amino acid transport system ATP-binding protein
MLFGTLILSYGAYLSFVVCFLALVPIMSLLEINNISKRFGGLQAVKDVSFTVQQGSIKAVIGPNGAGKTTLFNLISGFLGPDSGAILYQGKPIQGKHPHEIAALGLSRTFQHIQLFAHMTALENVMVGCHITGRAGFLAGMLNLPWTWREEREIRGRAQATMDFLGIANLTGSDATSLSYGQQRAVELARALAGDPTMLMLDEPAAGLNMRETADMAKLITRVRDRGVTVLIVEHDMQLVMNISAEIVVLSYGEKIADDVPRAVQANPEVIRVYLGEDDA